MSEIQGAGLPHFESEARGRRKLGITSGTLSDELPAAVAYESQEKTMNIHLSLGLLFQFSLDLRPTRFVGACLQAMGHGTNRLQAGSTHSGRTISCQKFLGP